MDKKKGLSIVLVGSVIAAVVFCFLFLDEFAAQLVSILAVVIVAAVVMVWSLDHSALHALVLTGAPMVATPLLSYFAETEFAVWLSNTYIEILAFLCGRIGRKAPHEVGSQTALTITFWVVFFLVYVLSQIVRKRAKSKTTANSGGSALDKDFPERNYKQKRKSFCKFLAKRIDAINEETNWSEETFTPIDAEVEATVKRRKKRRYEDLHKCLRRHRRKNTVFLVLGDPGSGKSVSMRKLCAEMLEEADKTDLIPVYVDLKKWTEDWSLERKPTEEDLVVFIERILREGGTTYTDEFLRKYFRKMLERGKWYFIFDSFDEMPCLMGRKSCQELIDHISFLLHTFLTRENQRGGVIASRLFRAPTDALHAAIKLNLQSFSDAKIKKMLNLYTNNSNDLVQVLFGGREDLVSLCRNPFYLALLIEYSMNHGAALPENQMDLYEDFIQSRLDRCTGRIEEEGLTVRQVRDAARQLALYMQNSTQYGLECPASELYRQSDGYDWHKILDLLRYAKLCRFGGASSTVSFVHRRFQECFYVTNILENRIHLHPESYSAIEKNTGIRDALVLYCEIAPLEKAREIAAHCWAVLQQNKDAARSIRKPGCVELVNTLYFMAEAFRNRREALAAYQDDFQVYAMEMLECQEFIVQYAAASSMVLFEQHQLLEMVLKVLERENRFLSGVVMKNCRTMTEIPWEISHKMAIHLVTLDSKTFLRQFFSMDFSLSLSKQLRYVRLVHANQFVCELLYRVTLAAFFSASFAFALMMPNRMYYFIDEIGQHWIRILPISLIWVRIRIDMLTKREDISYFDIMILLLFAVSSMFFMAMPGTWVLLIPVCIIYMLLLFEVSGIYWIQILRRDTLRDIALRIKKHLGEFFAFFRKTLFPGIRIMLIIMISAYLPFVFLRTWKYGYAKLMFGLYQCAACIIICMSIVYTIQSEFRQRCWLRRQLPVTTLDRSMLITNMETHLPDSSHKKRYLEELVERKVKLTGEWPDGLRPKMRRDDAERLLAILDCGDIENLRMEF